MAQSQWRDLGASPAPAVPATAVNSTQINFAGHEWVVIGNDTNRTYGSQPNGSVTVLLKSNGTASYEAGGGFGGTMAFRESGSTCAGSYAGSCSVPSDYNTSTLQSRMVTIASGFGKELDVITERTLTSSSDGIGGADVANQKLWALSDSEWSTINDNSVTSYPSSWWLRSPLGDFNASAGWFGGGYIDYDLNYVDLASFVVRPAFNLDLQSVLFASDARVSFRSIWTKSLR
ncbi:hypothetical protein AGMMS49545_19880 [Betaproteobacteria bacterium]|nr:hypothetical protein AGMMS49545_19880 [Betaproteobacteria bacterium]GHU49127.1 hypothetical protein AGMMS50289_26150 [Betaproteobacteria bacterium]